MRKVLIYDVPLLEITVSLNQNGYNVYVNRHYYCQKSRSGHSWLEREDKNERIYLHLLDKDSGVQGYSTCQEQYFNFSYRQVVRPENKEKSIEFLKKKAFETASGWAVSLNRMLQSALA